MVDLFDRLEEIVFLGDSVDSHKTGHILGFWTGELEGCFSPQSMPSQRCHLNLVIVHKSFYVVVEVLKEVSLTITTIGRAEIPIVENVNVSEV